MVESILQISNLSEVLPGMLRSWLSLTFTSITCSIGVFLYQSYVLEQLQLHPSHRAVVKTIQSRKMSWSFHYSLSAL